MGLLFLLLILINTSDANNSSPFFVKVAHHRSQIRRSFTFPSKAFGDHLEDIRLVGNAAVMSDGSIKIPAPDSETNQAGRALFSSPVRMWDPNTSFPASFDTSFSFVIHRESSNASGTRRSGGGLAFIIAPDEVTVGREAGYLGMLSDSCVHRTQHPVIGVEFDTFKDEQFGDPNDNHVGLNLGSIVSDQTADLAQAGVYLRKGSIITAKITYESSSQNLQVYVNSRGHKQQALVPLISSPVDLTKFLKEYMFVGFSASTGADALSHTVLSWNFSCTSHAIQRFPPPSVSRDAVSRASPCEDAIVEDKFDHDRGKSQRKHPPASFFVFISVSVTLLFIILNVLIFMRRRIRSRADPPWSLPVALLPPRPVHKPREFEWQELIIATGDFAEKQKLGEGPLGAVYRGSLQDGSLVAVKKFNVSPFSYYSTFLCFRKTRKLDILPALIRLKHAHLVPVRGWCISGLEFAIVYEYMPNASIDKWLHPGETLSLPWIHRWKLAKEVAEALHYLHNCNHVHRRIKSSNVLLDITFQARLGDFGLSERKESYSGVHVPPEMSSSTSCWTKEMDVFGYGVLCLELLTGGTVDSSLVDRAWHLHETGGLVEFADSRLEESGYDMEEAMVLYKVGLICTYSDPKLRPSMDKILVFLRRILDIPTITTR